MNTEEGSTTESTIRFDGAIHDEANADIGHNREGERVVRLGTLYTRGPGVVDASVILTVGAAIALRNQLDGLFAAAGSDDGDASAGAPGQDLLEAAIAALRLWNKHGLGDDEAESEPVHQALVNAIVKAKGLI